MIKTGETVYFKNTGEPVTVKATVSKVEQFENLDSTKTAKLLSKYSEQDLGTSEISQEIRKYTEGKKYAIMIHLEKPQKVNPFNINKSGHGLMSAWLCVKNLGEVKVPLEDSLARNSKYHIRFALLAAREAEKVLPFFEQERPDDLRPRKAIEAIREWAEGKRELGMKEVRKLALDAHAAARAAETDAARFAARAAGHAIATWHVPTHAMAVPIYAGKAMLANERHKNS